VQLKNIDSMVTLAQLVAFAPTVRETWTCSAAG
jgi:hypothetical protein